jgi:tetratricopeptide (TPR) repeat protein
MSTLGFRGPVASLAEVRQRLGVQYIVSGRWWRAGDRLSLAVELIDAQAASACWTRMVDFTVAEAFAPDGDLINDLSAAIAEATNAAQLRQVHEAKLPTLSSHVLLLRAIQQLFQQHSPERFDESRRALQTLHERSPTHPLPLAWLAQWHVFMVVQGWSRDRERDAEAARAHALQALEHDPSCALALTMLANVHTTVLGDLDTADALFRQATAASPSEALAWLQWANTHSFRGDGAQAVAYARHALRLAPLGPTRHFFDAIMASAALTAGDYDLAIHSARASLALNPAHVSTHRVLAIALSVTGRADQARAAVQRLRELQPALTVHDYVARSPGRASGLASKFGHALELAGLPP